jgi:methionine biosynthesis protein MetW
VKAPAHPDSPERRAARAEIIRATAAILRELDPSLGETGLEALIVEALPAAPLAPPSGERWQDRIIERELERGSTLLDLGCGRGELLSRLIRQSGIRGQGVEWDAGAVVDCVRRGVPVLQMDIDRGLQEFPDGSFDYVLIEDTLQTLRKPLQVLKDMLRVGRNGIVSFPNFGCWRVRLALALTGRMPRTESLPHFWHDTPNIHLFTLRDFLEGAESVGIQVVKGYARVEGEVRPLQEATDNLMADEVLLFVGAAS